MNKDKFACVITGPTYAGKTTLSNKLISEYGFLFPKQSTTRDRRLDDIEEYYRYFNVDDFNKLKEKGDFLFYSGAENMSYGILKEDIEDTFLKTDKILINISYENIAQYNLLEYQKMLITLTYRNIENGVLNRIKLSDRKMSLEEVQKRIMISKFLHDLYFDRVRKSSDCIIYTDENNEIQTFELVRKVLRKKLGEGKR